MTDDNRAAANNPGNSISTLLEEYRVKSEAVKVSTRHVKMVSMCGINIMMDFFNNFIIAFVLASIIGPWGLTYGQSSVVLLSSGIGAALGAFAYGRIADIWGRRPATIICILNFNVFTFFMVFVPDNGWVILSILRVCVGFGIGGLIVIIIALIQELSPARLRGRMVVITSMFIQAGSVLAAGIAAMLIAVVGWRGLFMVSLVPMISLIGVIFWVPESPRWLEGKGRFQNALNVFKYMLKERRRFWDPQDKTEKEKAGKEFVVQEERKDSFSKLFRYPRSVTTTMLINFGVQFESTAFTMWGVAILMMVLEVPITQAAYYFLIVSTGGFIGRLAGGFLADSIGRRLTGILYAIGTSVCCVVGAFTFHMYLGAVPVLVIVMWFISVFGDGGTGLMVSYVGEVWPKHMRASGLGWGAGTGNIARIVAPLILAVLAGSSNLVQPAATAAVAPGYFMFMAGAILLAVIGYAVGYETKGKSIEEIDKHFMK